MLQIVITQITSINEPQGTFGKEECVEKNETTMDCGSDQFVTIVESEVHDPTLMGGAYMGENQPSSEEESGDEGSTPMNEDKQDKKIYIKSVFFFIKFCF